MSDKKLKEGVDFIYNEDGQKVNPETGKLLKGFALNPKGINLGGRPKGSRNKSSMLKAQIQLDEAAEVAVSVLIALATNDKESLDIKADVPATTRLAAAKEILNKVIANEKEKPLETLDKSTDVEEDDDTPIVSTQPIAKSSWQKSLRGV